MTKTLVADEVVAEARRVTGLEKFDSDSYREGLDILISDFNKQQVADEFCNKARTAMVGSLAMRLRVTDYLDKHPELLQRSIERPVFVCGMTRTGTTLVSNLLATDPARLSALTWLIDDPIPPTPKPPAMQAQIRWVSIFIRAARASSPRLTPPRFASGCPRK